MKTEISFYHFSMIVKQCLFSGGNVHSYCWLFFLWKTLNSYLLTMPVYNLKWRKSKIFKIEKFPEEWSAQTSLGLLIVGWQVFPYQTERSIFYTTNNGGREEVRKGGTFILLQHGILTWLEVWSACYQHSLEADSYRSFLFYVCRRQFNVIYSFYQREINVSNIVSQSNI